MRPLIMFGGILAVAATAAHPCAAQMPSPLDRPVSLALGGVPLKDALDEVARRAGVRIAYSGRVVPLDRRVSLQLDAVQVRAALDSLLHGTGAVPTVDRSGQILLVTTERGHGTLRHQTGTIAGNVRDALTSAPLPSANVALVGTRFATTTDGTGHYTITAVPAGSYRVRARALGYAPSDTTLVVADGQETALDLSLHASAIELNPIVAIGYGSVEKRNLTGAVASISGEQFETPAAPTVTLSSGLQGKAAGVQVVSNTGLPGGGLRVRVRGTGSITANSEPLYVIDGVPALQGTGSSNPQDNPLISIDPNEIASIDVLKDVSATAIYGARGANGVVLITTNRGRRNDSRLTVALSYGRQKISNTIPVLGAVDFMTITNEARANANRSLLYTPAQIAAAQTYDYAEMLLQTAAQTDNAITFSGGDQRLRYLLSGNYTKMEGIEFGSDFQRFGIRLNLDSDVRSRFRIGTSLNATRASRNAPAQENGSLGNGANGMEAAMQFAPFQAPHDSTGNWIKQSPTTEPVPNPLASAHELQDLNTFSRLLGSVYAELDIASSLTLRSTFGGNFQYNNISFFAPRTILAGGAGGSGFINATQSRDLTNENTLTYRRPELGPGNLELLGGFSVQSFHNERVTANAANFPTDETTIYGLGSGSQLIPPGSDITESAILSYLGRAKYDIRDKYLFTFTGRRDGSSVFGANHKWAFFPSGAFAWRISDEDFMRRQSLFSDLKLRLSYGEVGSQAVAPYQSLSALGTVWYASGTTEIPALAPTGTMPNPDLRWEKKAEFNVGVDASFLANRIALTLDAYRATTEDLLLSVTVPSTTGYASQLRNIGSVRNAGLEMSLSTLNLTGAFKWQTTFNIAHNRNWVDDLGTGLNAAGNRVPIQQITVTPRTGNFFSPGDVYVVRLGQPLGSIYGYRVVGLWQAGDACYLKNPATSCIPGEYKMDDVNGDSVIDANDRVILGHGDPDFFGGLANRLTYGAVSLDFLFTFAAGNKIINAGAAYGCLGIMQANERTCMLDRWTPTHTNTTVPRANNARPRRLYSSLVEDGSYLRLKTLTLSVDLPTKLIRGMGPAQLFITGQNLWITTKYTGFDPDVNSMGGDARFGGIDIGAYPQSRIWNVGVSATY